MRAPPGRAEAYLRMMAEDELRRALAYPRYEPPRPPGLPSAAQSAVRLSRPLLAPLVPPLSVAARMSGSLLGSLRPAARTAAQAARQAPAGRGVEPVLWRVMRVRHAVQPRLPRPGRAATHPADEALDRVRRVAGTLVSAGVISEAAAQEVVQSLMDALAVRGKLGPDPMRWPPGSGLWGPRFPRHLASTPRPLPAAPVRAIPIGTTLPLGPGGSEGTACLLALATGPGRAVVTAMARRPGPGPHPRHPWPRPGPPLRFGEITATDERGARYHADDTARSAQGRWSVTFDLLPVPPPATRWLDITGPYSTRPVRVELIHAPGPADPPADPGGSTAGLPARLCPADRPLDSLAESWLAQAAPGQAVGDPHLAGLTEVAGALQATAGLTPGSAALSRLAALAGQLGIEFPAALRPLIQPVKLPDAWVSVLDNRGAADGPDRAAAVAAVLPEVDGARFAVAGLNSAALSVTLHAVGWGWEPRPLPGLGQPCYSWWARDDQGRWHVGRARGGNRGGVVDLLVEFGPALHPGARALELIVRGPASQATVTLPLPWMESQ
jgi:hypothetical protein